MAMVDTLPVMSRTKKDPTENIRLSISVVRKIRFLAADADKSIPDYLADLLKPIVDKKYAELLARLPKEEFKRRTD